MRSTFFKGINVLGTLMNLGILILFMWGTANYAPKSPVTLFVWLVGIAVFGYIVLSVWCKINDHRVNHDIQRYYGL